MPAAAPALSDHEREQRCHQAQASFLDHLRWLEGAQALARLLDPDWRR